MLDNNYIDRLKAHGVLNPQGEYFYEDWEIESKLFAVEIRLKHK